jgi:hypothetical protein
MFNPASLYKGACSSRELNELDELELLSLGGASYGILQDYDWPKTLSLIDCNEVPATEPREVQAVSDIAPVFTAKRIENMYEVSTCMYIPAGSVAMASILRANYNLKLEGAFDQIVTVNSLSRQFTHINLGDRLGISIPEQQPQRILSALAYSIRYLRRFSPAYESL